MSIKRCVLMQLFFMVFFMGCNGTREQVPEWRNALEGAELHYMGHTEGHHRVRAVRKTVSSTDGAPKVVSDRVVKVPKGELVVGPAVKQGDLVSLEKGELRHIAASGQIEGAIQYDGK